ncbi:hypothetical protein U1Q18_051910, partial [Sarracenia purpurea var. burkii]
MAGWFDGDQFRDYICTEREVRSGGKLEWKNRLYFWSRNSNGEGEMVIAAVDQQWRQLQKNLVCKGRGGRSHGRRGSSTSHPWP